MRRVVPNGIGHREWDPLPLRPAEEQAEAILGRAEEEGEIVIEVVDPLLVDGPVNEVVVDDKEALLSPGMVTAESASKKDFTELLLFGNTEEGVSVCIRAQGFRPKLRVYDPDPQTLKVLQARASTSNEIRLPNLLGNDTNIDDISEDAPLSQRPTWKMHRYVELSFATIADRNRAMRSAPEGTQFADSKTSVLTQALLQARINTADLVRATELNLVDVSSQVSTCQAEYVVPFANLSSAADGRTFPKVVMAYDGEMFSHTGLMPTPAKRLAIT